MLLPEGSSSWLSRQPFSPYTTDTRMIFRIRLYRASHQRTFAQGASESQCGHFEALPSHSARQTASSITIIKIPSIVHVFDMETCRTMAVIAIPYTEASIFSAPFLNIKKPRKIAKNHSFSELFQGVTRNDIKFHR